jgi:uncharacterized protein (DUF952 family)
MTRDLTPTIFHLALAADWARDPSAAYDTSTVGVSLAEQGFIHCSFDDQVEPTASASYRGRDDVLLLEIEVGRLEARVQIDDGFPHIYGPLNRDAVVRVTPYA